MNSPVSGSDAPSLDYLDHLARETARFALVLDGTPAQAQVPTCPGWNADDLLWHLAEVQWFWGTIVSEKILTGGDLARITQPERPVTRAGLRQFFASASTDLGELLAGSEPETPAWSWASDQTVGFIRRRQAHEALIHRVDAELTGGSRTSMDPLLSADGVDEALRIMYHGEPPAWGSFAADNARSLRVSATDTGGSWHLTLGQFTGTDPDDQRSYDEAGFRAAETDDGSQTAATISGTAADLDCWLWHRPALSPVSKTGDESALSAFEAIIARGIN